MFYSKKYAEASSFFLCVCARGEVWGSRGAAALNGDLSNNLEDVKIQ
jgi:hypothetical protein